MKSFTYNGKKFLNGYACDSYGRPITMKNGYSSEDEKDARQDYLDALELSKHKSTKKENASPMQKYSKKTSIEQEPSAELLAMYEKEYQENRAKSKEGYMLNDAGEKISLENGYTDSDEKFTKRQVKNMSL